jgi:uncharacterized membrane protein
MTRRRQRRSEVATPRPVVPNGADRASTAARNAFPARRVAIVDALRGFAICLMIVYHGCFDLNWFGVIHADFNNDIMWLTARAVIVTMFLSLVGVGLVLARRTAQPARKFWNRVAVVGGCALVVSVVSYIVFPATYIFFGILHCVVIATLLAAPLVERPVIAIVAGVAIVAIGLTVKLQAFDTPWLNWIGMMTHKPPTEDYVPLFPWLGVVLIGVALGNWCFRPHSPAVERASPAWLRWTGRHSLIIYMVHQPILIGLLRATYG